MQAGDGTLQVMSGASCMGTAKTEAEARGIVESFTTTVHKRVEEHDAVSRKLSTIQKIVLEIAPRWGWSSWAEAYIVTGFVAILLIALLGVLLGLWR